jgi:hypothetical protein
MIGPVIIQSTTGWQPLQVVHHVFGSVSLLARTRPESRDAEKRDHGFG